MAKKEMTKEERHLYVDESVGFASGDEFEKELTKLMAESETDSANSIVIALIDLDHFMRVNSDFGYEEGDRVIIATGKFIKDNLPSDVTPYKIHGDEFAVIFGSEYEKEDAFLLMEKLRSSFDVKLPDGSRQTISIGIAAAFEDANRFPELVRKAESAMFRAKSNGADRIGLAKEEKMIPKTSHYTQDQLKALTKLSKREGVGEAILLREALDMLLKKYDV